MILRAGQTAKIYHDPIAGKHLEGEATLKECTHQDEGDGLSMWLVQFNKNTPGWIYHGWTYLRTVNETNAHTIADQLANCLAIRRQHERDAGVGSEQ